MKRIVTTALCGVLALPVCTGAILLSGCGAVTTTTTNGVTTVTVNVADINTWATALLNGVKLLTVLPGISGTPQAAVVSTVGTLITADLAAFNTAAAGSVSLTFNATSVPAALASLMTDGNTLLADAQKATTGVLAADVTVAQTYVAAIQTVVSLVQAAAGTPVVGVAASAMPMTEAQALAVLTAKK